MLSWLSAGPMLGGGSCKVEPGGMDEFVDLVRRLHVPWYEEARPNERTKPEATWPDPRYGFSFRADDGCQPRVAAGHL
jgi:hypothetical protein